MSEGLPTPGKVRGVIEQLSPEERNRLVRALAEALLEQVREKRRVESWRKLR